MHFFFWQMLLKKITELNTFSNFLFYLKLQSFRLIMENNFIQMAASAFHAVVYRSFQFLKTLSIVCSCISSMGSRILSFKASIAYGLSAQHLSLTATHKQQSNGVKAPRWLNDISSAADNPIFRNRAQNIECSAVLLKQMLPISSSSIFVNKNSFNMSR